MTPARDFEAEASALAASAEPIIAATREWIEKAVIGLELCPFAQAPYARGIVRFRVSEARSAAGVAHDLSEELLYLRGVDQGVCETTLLIHPYALNDFDRYNQFLDEADAAVETLGLSGELQVASFHPAYRFAGTRADDVENYSNRSPYPMLHLLREASVTRAVEMGIAADDVANKNIATLRKLGAAGWKALLSPPA